MSQAPSQLVMGPSPINTPIRSIPITKPSYGLENHPIHAFRYITEGDTLIYIDTLTSPRPPLRLPSSSLLSTDSEILQKYFSPTYQYRVLRRKKLLKNGIPMGVKFVIDLTPPIEGEEAVEVTEKLWCPEPVLRWKTNPHKLARRYFEPEWEDDFGAKTVQTVFPELRQLYKEAWGPKRPFPLEEKVDANKEVEKTENVKAEQRLPAEYSLARHVAALERVLGILMGIDPHIYSATMCYTIVKVAEMLGVGKKVAEYVLEWFNNGNIEFIEFFTPLCIEIAEIIQSPELFRNCFSLAVSRQLAGVKDNYPRYQTNMNAACQAIKERTMKKWKYIFGMAWFDELEIIRLFDQWLANKNGEFDGDFLDLVKTARKNAHMILKLKLDEIQNRKQMIPSDNRTPPRYVDSEIQKQLVAGLIQPNLDNKPFTSYPWMYLHFIDLFPATPTSSTIENDSKIDRMGKSEHIYGTNRLKAFRCVNTTLINGTRLVWPRSTSSEQPGSSLPTRTSSAPELNPNPPTSADETYEEIDLTTNIPRGYVNPLIYMFPPIEFNPSPTKTPFFTACSLTETLRTPLRITCNNTACPIPADNYRPTERTPLPLASAPPFSSISSNPTLSLNIDNIPGAQIFNPDPNNPHIFLNTVSVEWYNPPEAKYITLGVVSQQVRNRMQELVAELYKEDDETLMRWMDTGLQPMVTEEDWKFMPVWAGGNHDGSEDRKGEKVLMAGNRRTESASSGEGESDDEFFMVLSTTSSAVLVGDEDIRQDVKERGSESWSFEGLTGSVIELGDHPWENVVTEEGEKNNENDDSDGEVANDEDDGDQDTEEEDDDGDDPIWNAEIERIQF